MTSVSLSALDLTLIDGLKDQLADEFARRIFDASPEISDCIEFEAEGCNNVTGKKRFERASQLLYSRRRDLQSQTAAVVRRIFNEKLFRLVDGDGQSARLSLDGITLLADERLDEEIAVSHCSRRLKEQCGYELWSLTQRVATLVGINHPADGQNPVFPQTFAQALMEAIGTLESDPGVRLVVFKTFGPVLLEIVPAVFVVANAALKARGIDVESCEYYGRPVLAAEAQTLPQSAQQEFALGAAKVNLALTSALKQILAKSESSLSVNVKPQDGPASIGEPAGGRTLHGARSVFKEKLARDEQVVGDIITDMFGRLLTDPRLPAQLRETVAQLQLPVLALALKDRSLLMQVDHPVRKLIDLIAEFGLTLGRAGNDDSTVRTVASIVQGLVQIHKEEPNAFKLAFNQLDGLFYHHEEAALQVDSDLRALERHEAVEFAGSQADREIALRLQNITLPASIRSFVQTAWREVLVHNYVYGGPTGEPWRLGLATLDDTVKSLLPSTSETERRRLAKILPRFIETLLDTVDTASDQGDLAANFFAGLHRAHELALDGKWAEIGGERCVPSSAALATSHTLASPSAALTALGLACGDWIETNDVAGIRRWRLNWITSIFGTCVFKHYESNSVCNMSCEELRERLSSGEIHRVRGLGLADDVLNSAFETVSRKARQEEVLPATRGSGTGSGDVLNAGISDQCGPSPLLSSAGGSAQGSAICML